VEGLSLERLCVLDLMGLGEITPDDGRDMIQLAAALVALGFGYKAAKPIRSRSAVSRSFEAARGLWEGPSLGICVELERKSRHSKTDTSMIGRPRERGYAADRRGGRGAE
jgi:hypothetical protein